MQIELKGEAEVHALHAFCGHGSTHLREAHQEQAGTRLRQELINLSRIDLYQAVQLHRHQDLHCIKPDYIDLNINVKLYDYIKP
jgi:hypothetical protein